MASSLACRPGYLETEFNLQPHDATLNNEQIQALIHWYAIWKTGANARLGVTEIGIYARTTKNNDESLRLANERIANLKRLIEIADSDHAPFVASINQLSLESPAYPYIIDEIAIGIQPECTKTQTCCP
jgi:hypothetical protein